MKRTFNVLLLAGLLVTNSAFSNPLSKPTVCPSVASIIAEGLDYAEKDASHDIWMVAKLKSKYDTNDDWTFITMVGQGNENETAALEAGTILLTTLSLSEGPKDSDMNGKTECDYESRLSPFIMAFAINPPLDPPSGIARFTQMLQVRR